MTTQSLAHQNKIIYFDNAATTFPKPKQVTEAVVEYMTGIGANPGRAGHRKACEAGKIVFEARKELAKFFGVKSPMNVIFGSNATDVLNLAIKGVLNRGDHVITTSMEHNSVIRPLKRLEKDGIITLTVLEGNESGVISTQEIEEATLGSTRLFVFNHMSNVTGAVQPAAEIGKFCREKGIITIADCAQSAGIIPVSAEKDRLDIICGAGHKGLYGPTGTGVMIVRDSFDFKKIKPLKEGGTGSLSDSTDHPEFMPDKFESGTLNVAGIAGLAKGVAFLNSMDGGLSSVQEHKRTLQKYFIEKAEKYVPGFRSLSAKDGFGVVSFAVEEFSTSELTQRLSEEFNIMSRQGLHCAPLAHQRIGTFPEGTVRFGFSVFNTREEVDLALEALRIITKRKK